MKTWWMGLAACALMLAPGLAAAGNDAQATAIPASMVITGSIVIKPDGSVAGYTVDHAEKVAQGALVALGNAVPHWKFKPVLRDEKAVTAKSFMSVRLVARALGADKYRISIVAARFDGGDAQASLTFKNRVVPRYPWMGWERAEGTVYMLVEVGRDGKVEHAAARQVDLRTGADAAQMKLWREELANASRKALLQSTFNVPVEGPESHRDHWFAMIPFTYRLILDYRRRRPISHYGRWVAYIPGPQQYIPWAGGQELAGATDAIPANGGAFPLRQSLHLLSALGGS